MKCDKCGAENKRDYLRLGDDRLFCKECFDNRPTDDFRAFRRQVLLVLLSNEPDDEVLPDGVLWKRAGSIARAEPKGE